MSAFRAVTYSFAKIFYLHINPLNTGFVEQIVSPVNSTCRISISDCVTGIRHMPHAHTRLPGLECGICLSVHGLAMPADQQTDHTGSRSHVIALSPVICRLLPAEIEIFAHICV